MSAFTAPPVPDRSQTTARLRAAASVSDVLAPGHLVIALLLAVGWSTTHSWNGLGWGLFATVFCGFVPLGIVHLGVRRGTLTDRHIRVRRQRIVPMGHALLSVVTGLVVLKVLDAPGDVYATAVSMVAGLAGTLVTTVWWQISVHSAVATGAVVILLQCYGWWCAPAVPLVLVVMWSRLELKAHTVAQLAGGAALGCAMALLFQLFR
ncbi:hypothetical protein B9W62_04215 [Streptomyces sp. CS113]|uniref:hypothetical protein n=1 Tax=Streptomyces sp. CS113 TaxID=1982761 RepID=UPI000B40CB6E|nr:hypothetical protein [Streptomyces sp. CS113]OWA13900.1 hypothetical protein B9W62_04215 [Streptomyces sp. CS113]